MYDFYVDWFYGNKSSSQNKMPYHCISQYHMHVLRKMVLSDGMRSGSPNLTTHGVSAGFSGFITHKGCF